MSHILIVEARFYPAIADALLEGALECLEQANMPWERYEVPGAFEIPAAIQMAVRARADQVNMNLPIFSGAIALGCVIRGETTHYDYVCMESARALQQIAWRNAFPLGYGILTVENETQAWERARRDRKNKGAAAAEACLAMLSLKRQLGSI